MHGSVLMQIGNSLYYISHTQTNRMNLIFPLLLHYNIASIFSLVYNALRITKSHRYDHVFGGFTSIYEIRFSTQHDIQFFQENQSAPINQSSMKLDQRYVRCIELNVTQS